MGGARVLARGGGNRGLTRWHLAAALGQSSCSGVAVVSLGEESDVVGCQADSADPVDIAISASGDSVWLWVEDEVTVSTDGGVTWP